MSGDFSGQVVFITGGARGQGRCHALAFARAGAHVALCDAGRPVSSVPYRLGDAAELERTRKEVEALGVRCMAFETDVRDAEAVTAAVDATIDQLGRIDIALANAGILTYGAIGDLEPQAWQDMLDVNLTGVFHTARAVVPHMISRSYGRIVATASMAGRSGVANIAHYAASKWGVIGFMKCLAIETAGSGVTANVVAPTNVDTEMIQNQAVWNLFTGSESGTREGAARAFAQYLPMKVPWIQPEDVTRAVLFLASPDNSMVSGEVLHVSAGGIARQAV